ncbi:hypothetical protein ACFL9S_17800 [Erwinia sp. AnSW2-5]|uniref:hypothetical protein n=1 Tax=Erwinia sp. AnSW2-5 TaxID=3367692 RepID=UPI00385BD5C9
MRFTPPLLLLIPLAWLVVAIAPAHALDCGLPPDVAERTICATPQLTWLDGIYNDTFHDRVIENPQQAGKLVKPWLNGIENCTSVGCLRNAYLSHISRLFEADRKVDWSGVWWNTTVSHGNSGRMQISHQNAWGFLMNATVQGGIYHTVFNGEVRFHSGVGFTDKIVWGGDCAIMLVPLSSGKMKVISDSLSSCGLLLPGEMSIDGIYTRSETDPRPPATLLSLGIMPDHATDEVFRQLVGSDYQKYVDTATDFNYSEDLDNFGATVVSLWMKGMANRQSAIIMTTPQGQIWALRAEPAVEGKGVTLHYSTTASEKNHLPKTLAAWQARFIRSSGS